MLCPPMVKRKAHLRKLVLARKKQKAESESEFESEFESGIVISKGVGRRGYSQLVAWPPPSQGDLKSNKI